jgi:hypothetical protein
MNLTLGENSNMAAPSWTKPAIMGGIVGAICLGVVGFAGAGWVTESKARTMSADRSAADVVAALLPICLHQAATDPRYDARLVSLKGKQQAFQQTQSVEEWGWATMPGSERARSALARACARKLVE